MNDGQAVDAVGRFVDETWDGRYITQQADTLPGYRRVWRTFLRHAGWSHGVDRRTSRRNPSRPDEEMRC